MLCKQQPIQKKKAPTVITVIVIAVIDASVRDGTSRVAKWHISGGEMAHLG